MLSNSEWGTSKGVFELAIISMWVLSQPMPGTPQKHHRVKLATVIPAFGKPIL